MPWRKPDKAPPTSYSVDTSSFIDPSLSESQSFEVFSDSQNISRGNVSRGNISRGNISQGNTSRGGFGHGANVSGLLGKKNDGSYVSTRQASTKKERR